jgi:hypothetical protein
MPNTMKIPPGNLGREGLQGRTMGVDPDNNCEHINYPLWGSPLLSEGTNERFASPAQEYAIHHVGVMMLHLSCLPNAPVQVARFGGENFGVLELDVIVMV